MNWRILTVLPFILMACNAYKVLVLCPMNGKSHLLYMSTFVHALLDRGHEVTYLTSGSLSHLELANYTEVLIDPPFNVPSKFSQKYLMDVGSGSALTNIYFLTGFTKVMNEYMYENPNVQKFIKSTGLHFDVIFAEEFFSESLYMLAHKHKAPLVTICPFGIVEHVDRQQGLFNPTSFVPYHVLQYSDNMTFIQRWYNTFVVLVDWMVRDFIILPAEERLAQKYFAHLAPLPPLQEILKNISINLISTHRALSPPRPSMPSVISIGGAHIKPSKPLPSDLQKFLDEAENGVIYFSFGSVIQSSKLSKELIQAFLNTFKTLKQRVLWKYEDESFTDIPSNIMIRKWMPQNDILAHPNVILYISHGGLFGTSEALHHGVPLLLIPFFGDQSRNAYLVELAGCGKFLKHQDITQEIFSNAVNQIISDATFTRKAKEVSAIFNANLVHPMDEAMFWIEHVARFKGAAHLKSHAVNMSWFTYLLLDVILVSVVAVIAILFVLFIFVKKLICGKCKSKAKAKINAEKKRK